MNNFSFSKPLGVKFYIDEIGLVDSEFNGKQYCFKDVNFYFNGNKTYLKADTTLISHVYLSYPLNYSSSTKVFGDCIERGYGDLRYYSVIENRQMFWYCLVNDEVNKSLQAFGVNVQPNTIVSFKVKDNLLLVDINTQCGGSGVDLSGRTLFAASFVSKTYTNEDVFKSCQDFMEILMGEVKIRPLFHPAYGFNNWYYAYGVSNYDQIIKDTKLLNELTKDIPNKPYMVIDDGWSVNSCSGPWINDVNKFNDMAKLAKEIKSYNALPGIWFRPLKDTSNNLLDCRHPLNPEIFDPSCDEVMEQIRKDVTKFVSWGYELIKLDFVTVDIYWKYGFEMDENLCSQGFRFKNNKFTNAEIILKMYNTIRDAAKDAVLIGCNAIGHLCAGICELNRIGDDTSGFEWERTRKYGVNSLAYKLFQNNIFYAIDADCVGIMDKIDWEQNKEWLNLLAISGSPLFVSFDPDKANDINKKDVREAFLINYKQINNTKPMNFGNELLPSKWLVDNQIKEFNWFKEK